jgi:hypothetical protein
VESGLPALESRVHWRSTLARMTYCFSGATNRLENRRPLNSCEGDPEPRRALAAAAPSGLEVLEGKRPPEGGSTGDAAPLEEAECGALELSWGRYAELMCCSGREVGAIMDYRAVSRLSGSYGTVGGGAQVVGTGQVGQASSAWAWALDGWMQMQMQACARGFQADTPLGPSPAMRRVQVEQCSAASAASAVWCSEHGSFEYVRRVLGCGARLCGVCWGSRSSRLTASRGTRDERRGGGL